jgi:hypothetical protein
MSKEEENMDNLFDNQEDEREEVVNIRNALDWKRRHFFVSCFIISLFLLMKMEYSYSNMF